MKKCVLGLANVVSVGTMSVGILSAPQHFLLGQIPPIICPYKQWQIWARVGVRVAFVPRDKTSGALVRGSIEMSNSDAQGDLVFGL